MESTALIITVASAFASGLLIIKTLRDAIKERVISTLAPIVSILATILITVIYILLTGAQINWLVGVPVFVLGAVFGRGQGAATRMYYRGNVVFGKADLRYLLYWGSAYLVTLIMGQLGNVTLQAVGIMTMLFGLGVAVGANLVLLTRRLTLKREPIGSESPLGAPRPANLPESAAKAIPTDLPERSKRGSGPKPRDLPR